MNASRALASLLITCAAFACSGEQRAGTSAPTDGGTLIVASIAEPTGLIPQVVTSGGDKQIVDQIFDYLAEIGPDLNTFGDRGWIPRLADSWTWAKDSMSIAFHLNPRARFHDGTPVRASDVAFSLGLYKDPKVRSYIAESFANIDSASVADSLTAVVWFRRRSSEEFFQVAYNLMIVPEHLLRNVDRANLAASDFAKHPVGSGPFRLVSWTPRQAIELEADTTYYRGRPHLDRLIWSWNANGNAAATTVLSGDADILEFAPLEAMTQAAATPLVRAVRYPSINLGYLIFNVRDPRDPHRPHPVFGDRGVRVALATALDRDAMRRNVFDSLGIVAVGPFSHLYATADTTIPQFGPDSAAAARELDSLGWRDSDGDGVRDRHGVPLRFSLVVPVSSPPRMRYAPLIQSQLKQLGVRVDIEELDPNAMVPRMLTGRFDAVINTSISDPSPSAIRQNWHTGATDEGNFGGYSSPLVDAVIDSAVAELNPEKAIALYRRAYRFIDADAPAVWLYETSNRAIVHRRIHTVMGTSDYWWRDIRLWWIPANERIARDKIH